MTTENTLSIENLRSDFVEAKPADIDWREALGEDLEGYRVAEVASCGECDEDVVCNGFGHEEHRDVQPTITIEDMPESGTVWKCPVCKVNVEVPEHDEDDSFLCPNEECGEYIYEEAEFDNKCLGSIYSDGPMMNYHYPVGLDNVADIEDAARAVAHTNLCVVEFQDGSISLALTGGGMDFTWEICEAYIRLGYLPPVHFAGRLPRMGGLGKNARLIAAACKQSCEIALEWAKSRVEEAERIEAWLTEQEQKEGAA